MSTPPSRIQDKHLANNLEVKSFYFSVGLRGSDIWDYSYIHFSRLGKLVQYSSKNNVNLKTNNKYSTLLYTLLNYCFEFILRGWIGNRDTRVVLRFVVSGRLQLNFKVLWRLF